MKASRILDICVPTYNRCRKLTELIKFLDSELSSLESRLTEQVGIIISDNASSDGTKEIKVNLLDKEIVHKDNFMLYRNDDNIGIVANAYKVMGYAESQYVWVLGDDDLLDEGVLGRVLQHIERYNPNFVFLNHDLFVGKKKSSLICCVVDEGYFEDSYEMIKKHLYLNTCALGLTSAVVFKQSILKQIAKCLPLDGKLDYGWPYLAGVYAVALGRGYFENEIFLHKQSYGCSWDNVYYHAVYGSFCSIKKLKQLGCPKSKKIIKEVQRAHIEETNMINDLIKQIMMKQDRKVCMRFLFQFFLCDRKSTIKKIRKFI